MFRNLQIEWMKIKNYRVFQVFSVLYMLGILLIIYIFQKVYLDFIGDMQQKVTGVNSQGSDVFGLFGSDIIFQTVTYWTGLLLYLPGMIIINLFINEVNFKTHRQNIIDGWKRETFIYTKIGLIVCMSIAITIMNLIASLIMVGLTGAEVTAEGFLTLGLCFLQSFIYLMFALLLATYFRRSGIAIIVFFVYGLILEFVLMWMLSKISPSLQWFLPLEIGDALIPFPALKNFYTGLPNTMVLIAGALAFSGLYIYLTVRKYKYDDL